MNILSISDLHIIDYGDEAHKFYNRFISFALSEKPDCVMLLGDVFDFMVGSKAGFLKDRHWFFDSINKLLNSGIEVYFFEGNHDFHLEKIFNKAVNNNPQFHYLRDSLKLSISNKEFVFMHGDDLDLDKVAYKRWKTVYSSKTFKFIVNNIFPYRFIKWLGHWASENSRHRSGSKFDYEKFKDLYRSKVNNYFIANPKADILIAGHTHIKDKYEFDQKLYVNSGFPKVNSSAIQIKDTSIEFLEI